jgi:hypothetical protein
MPDRSQFQRMAVLLPVMLLFSSTSPALPQHDHGGHSGHGAPSHPAPQIRSGKEKDRVVAREENSITVEVSRKGQTVSKAFFITSETKLKGAVEAGADVEVKYREEGGRLLATSIAVK